MMTLSSSNALLAYKRISDDGLIPRVNLGFASRTAYKNWIDLGGRGFDTALIYGEGVHRALASAMDSSGLPREDFFLTTKIPCCPSLFCTHFYPNYYSENLSSTALFERTWQLLSTPYIDLLLLHQPCDSYRDTIAAYKTMETFIMAGKVRMLGLSNFGTGSGQLQMLFQDASIKPVLNQLRGPMSKGKLLDYKRMVYELGITVAAYSPLAKGNAMHWLRSDPMISNLSQTKQKTPAQIFLRYLIQNDIIVVVSSESPEHLKENLDLFSFDVDSIWDLSSAEPHVSRLHAAAKAAVQNVVILFSIAALATITTWFNNDFVARSLM